MLSVTRGYTLQALAEAVVKRLHRHPAANLLSPEIFVVPNQGMAKWLSLYIAETESVAANLEFKFPAEIFWEILRLIHPQIPEMLPSERGPMVWALMDILQDREDASLQSLYRYISSGQPEQEEVRRWQLVQRIADVFDQYLTYRPDLLRGWENGSLRYTDESEQWQANLWQKLNARWHQTGAATHRAHLQPALLKSIKEGDIDEDALPNRLTIFGISTMPPIYLRVIVYLSQLLDVSFYTQAGTSAAGHPLIKSFGTEAREFDRLLTSLVPDHIRVNRKFCDDAAPQGSSHTLFEAFKQDLQQHQSIPAPMRKDTSVQVHACHSPRREVEVLHDQLLTMMDEDPTLNPSDILVLSPDVEIYRSDVEGIFGVGENGLPEINYHFGERPATGDLVQESFLALLRLIDSRFTAPDVIDFIYTEAVRQRFDLSEEDLDTLETWIADNAIRWGIDGTHKASFDVPASSHFTWQSGLNRMMLGYAMKPENDSLFQQIYPYKEVDQQENAELAGRFSELMHRLFQCNQKAQFSHSLGEWSDILLQWVNNFFPDQPEFFASVRRLQEQLKTLREEKEQGQFSADVSFEIIRSWIKARLEGQNTGGGHVGRGVTFSSLIPMRNIPARVICLLGMNDDDFPRGGHPVSFDLIHQHPKRGDRRHNQEDRQLFLQTLQAAGERIYFSYVGHSNQEDGDFPPSVVLQEYMDYINKKFEISEHELITHHRLQPFSPAYFNPSSHEKLFSYSKRNKFIAAQLLNHDSSNHPFLQKSLGAPPAGFQQLTLDQLSRFFEHPARFLLQNRLGIYYSKTAVTDEEREAFQLKDLRDYQLGQRLFERFLEGEALAAYREVAFSRGFLPDAWPGEQAFAGKATEVTKFGTQLQQKLDDPKMEPFELGLHLDDFTLAGRLQQVYTPAQSFFRFGNVRAKDLIKLWIHHLAFQLVKPASHSGKSVLYATDKNKELEQHALNPPDAPSKLLGELLEIYWRGLREPFVFYPETSWAYARQIFGRGEDEQKALQKAKYKWKNSYIDYQLEGDDRYNICLLDGRNPLENKQLVKSFKKNASKIWHPFFKVYSE